MSTISLGSTLNIQFSFLLNGDLVDPDILTGEIYLHDGTSFPVAATDTFAVANDAVGVYSFDWTPNVEGKYLIKLTGEFDDSTPEIVHLKYFLIGDIETTNTLDSSYLVTILGELEPLYIDPEDILTYYPSGDLIEITEIIHRKSLELENKVGCDPIQEITALQHDFLVAATMCELSRRYGLTNGGLNGFSGADSFKLGDLEVSDGGANSRLATGKYDTGNADSWCELAISLKLQLTSSKEAMRSVVPGSDYLSPIPIRTLKSSDL